MDVGGKMTRDQYIGQMPDTALDLQEGPGRYPWIEAVRSE